MIIWFIGRDSFKDTAGVVQRFNDKKHIHLENAVQNGQETEEKPKHWDTEIKCTNQVFWKIMF